MGLIKAIAGAIGGGLADQWLEVLEADTDRDHFLTAEEARDYGLIDEIIAPRR